MVERVESSDRVLVDAVISALPSGVITVDTDGRVAHANRAAARMLGSDRESLVGKRLGDLRGELEAMLWPSERGEILLLPTGRSGELKFREHTVLGFSSRTVEDDEGERIGTVVSFSDITARKASERAEEHRRRLADIGGVVSSIAHEIRNPVVAISSLAQVMGGEDAVKDDADLQDMVQKIVEESRRIGRLVDDLLAFGRERKINRQRVDVVELVNTLVADVSASLGGRGEDSGDIPIRLEISDRIEEERTWSLDQESIRQVVTNLLRNAWHAVLARGRAREPDQGIDVHVDRVESSLEIRIVDQGVGIPEDKLPRVFDAFFTTRRKGTGLGLAIADRLIRQHRGTITLESKLREGTTIVIRLPP